MKILPLVAKETVSKIVRRTLETYIIETQLHGKSPHEAMAICKEACLQLYSDSSIVEPK